MADPARLTPSRMLVLSAQALGKVDLYGARGATMVSRDEVEAMACLLASLGVVPIPPGGPVPDSLFIPSFSPIEGAVK